MRILAAHVSRFRNLTEARFPLSEGLTAFLGANGQGKTNLLEAIFTVGALRPLRSVPRSELIQRGEERARVEVVVRSERTGLTHDLGVELARGARVLNRDGKPCRASEFLGHLVTVAFTPDDLALTKGSPELRRQLLDRALLNARPSYLDLALRYARALKARNRLLAQGAEDPLLDAYEETLAQLGAAITLARRAYIRELAPKIAQRFAEIAAPVAALTVRYRSNLPADDATHDADPSAKAFQAGLLARRPQDRRRGLTSLGPHLDDLELRLDGALVRARASQGQHRALVLAIKLAELSHLTEVLGEPPVLLLDDISSELDASRSRQLFECLAPLAGQVLLTTTDQAHLPPAIGGQAPRVYSVVAGQLALVDGRA